MTGKSSNPGMSIRIISAAKAFYQGLIELWMSFVIILWLYIYISPIPLLPWLLTLAVCYPAGSLIAGIIRVRKAAIFYIVLAVVAAIPAFAIYEGKLSFQLVATWLLLGCLLGRGALMSIRPWIDLFPNVAFVIGLIGYFIASILTGSLDAWRPYALLLQALGLVSLAITLFMTNRIHLNRSAPAGFSISKSIASRNWIWLSILFVLIMVFSYFSIIGNLIKAVAGFIGYVAATVLSWLLPKAPKAEMPHGTEPIALPELTKYESSIWDQIAYYAVKTLFILLAVLALICLAYLIIKWIVKLIRRLMHARNPFSEGQGFVDEKKKLLNVPERSRWGIRLRKRIGGMLKRELRWEQIADWRERVRWLYRRRMKDAIRRGYEPKPQLTPHEALADLRAWEKSSDWTHDAKLLKLYEQARYGTGNPMHDAEITDLYKNS